MNNIFRYQNLTFIKFLVACMITLPCVAEKTIYTAQSVCVYNNAAFDLHWHLHDIDHNTNSDETSSYPVWQIQCMSALKAGSDVTSGTSLMPQIQAVWGNQVTPKEIVLYDAVNTTHISYVCHGTTLDYDCILEPPPPTAADIAKDMGEFLLGFSESLGTKLGFEKCINDINSTYHDVITIIDFFESGINHKTLPAIEKAFELIGTMIKDIGISITECGTDSAEFVARIMHLSKILNGNVLSIIKIIIEDVVHIFNDRKEITDECKSTVTHWNAGDYEGSGLAVGDIVGIILNGLGEGGKIF